MYSRAFGWLVILLCSAPALRADVVVLKNGEHVEGQVVSETPDDVTIRRTFKTGNIKYTEKIRRSDIVRVERGPESTAEPAAPTAPETRPAAEPPLPTTKIPDKSAFLAGAIAKFQKPDYAAAGADLTRLINACVPAELMNFSARVEDKLSMTLAEAAATAHLEAALKKAKGRAVQVQYVTEYEKPSLIPMLDEAYKKALTAPVTVAPGERDDDEDDARERRRPNARRPANRRNVRADREDDAEKPAQDDAPAQATSRPAMTIKQWLDTPEDFNGDRREAAALAMQVYHASSLLGERMRLDPGLRKDPALRTELNKERGKLAALLKSVKARAGGALTTQEKEALEAERRNALEQSRLLEEARQQDVLRHLQPALEAQKRQLPQQQQTERDRTRD